MVARMLRFVLVLTVIGANIISWNSATVQAAPLSVGDNSILMHGVAPSSPPDLSGYISVPYSAALNPSSGGITIEAWVKRDYASRDETIVGNGFIHSYWLGFTAGKVRFFTHGYTSYIESTSNVPAGAWTHIAATYNGYTARIYINGVQDKIDSSFPGPIAPALGATALGIGADLVDDFPGNYFSGRLDEVRIWNRARTQDQIQADMFTSFGSPQPNLLAEWPLNGGASDPAGGHNGTLVGVNYQFSADGAIPHDIRVPQVVASPSLDGICSEYGTATQVVVGGANVYLMHNATDMWVCFENLSAPTGGHDNWAAVYLDPNFTRLDLAQIDHLSLEVHSDDTRRTRLGNGVGDYFVTTGLDSFWAGDYRVSGLDRSAEFRIASTLTGGWSRVIGLSLAQHWIAYIGNDVYWPTLSFYNSPRTWSIATLGGASAARTFTGQVVYLPKASSLITPGVGSAGVNLIGSDPDTGSEAVVEFVRSDLNGNFTLYSDDDYPNHRLELDPYTMPKGLTPYTAYAPAPGAKLDARTLDFGTAAAGSYSGAIFTLADAQPFPVDFSGPYFLIVAPQSVIDSGALDEFVTFKRWLGFLVEVKSLESIAAGYSGVDIGVKVRALEIDRLGTYGERFKYVMLVAPHSLIPMRFIKYYSKSAVACDFDSTERKTRDLWPHTDWYYIDLTSPWNRDAAINCWGDGIWSNPSEREPGYTPNTALAFKPTVALGRLPMTEPAAIRKALHDSIAFESQSNEFKSKALLALSMMALSCQKWNPDTSAYESCGSTPADGSYLGEQMRSGYLDANLLTSTRLYENQVPPTGFSQAHYISPLPNTAENVLNALNAQAYGLVGLLGHANSGVVVRTGWGVDANTDGILQEPTAPIGSPPKSVNEIGQPNMLTTASMSAVTPRNGEGAIYIIGGCLTGQYNVPGSLGEWLVSRGRGVAWIGATSFSIYASGWTDPSRGQVQTLMYLVAKKMVDGDQRLGDAVWQAMSERIAASHDENSLIFDLYGDPTLSYWGNPGGDATLAAWPMLRMNALGQGVSTLTGPGVPKVLWSYAGSAPSTDTLPPSPVASNRGEVIVAHNTYVDVLVAGALQQRLTLDAAAFGTPAIAADNTVYILDVSGTLYAFKPDLSCGLLCMDRYRRWAVSLGGEPLTSPVIGADGFIAIAYTSSGQPQVSLVRPDGFRPASLKQNVNGNPVGALAVDGNRSVFAATSSGYLYRFDLFCTAPAGCTASTTGSAFVTPPLLAYGAVYAGRSDHKVVKRPLNLSTELASYTVDAAISAGPVAGPGGQILVGTESGKLYSLTADLALRWQRDLGAAVHSVPAFSSDALYVVGQGQLQAFNPASGAPLWSISVDGSASDGSPAVGYGREIFVQTSTGNVASVGEGWGKKAIFLVGGTTVINNSIGGIKLDWGAPSPPPPPGLGGYHLQRRLAGGSWEDVAILDPSVTTYSDAGVQPGSDYEYRLQVFYGTSHDSDFSEMPLGLRSLPNLPQAPMLNRVVAESSDSIGLEWSPSANSEDTAYLIESSGSPNGPFTAVITVTSETSVYTQTLPQPGSSFFYRVSALNDRGASQPSNIMGDTTFQRNLPAPENVHAVKIASGQVQVSWSNMPQGATAIIEAQVQGQFGFVVIGVVAGPGPYVYTPELPNSYAYRVKFVSYGQVLDYAQRLQALVAEDESEYVLAPDRVVTGGFGSLSIFLPMVAR